MGKPLVSVVTPFFNTAPYLAECIESVLGQTYENFEYILMDNCSTDGSSEIAADYARRDSRIRLISSSVFLPQLPNYNRALAAISLHSQYCKIVEADNWIFPQCLGSMVEAFEQSESIGLVSSFWLYGNELRGSGLPYGTGIISGKDCAREYLLTGWSLFGAPTQVMCRCSLIREQKAFFNPTSLFFADVETAMEILKHWDLGFVHQVLSFARNDNESITRGVDACKPYQLLLYGMALRYAPVFLQPDEATSLIAKRKREYYRVLARASFLFHGSEFWRFHKLAIKVVARQEKHDRVYFAIIMALELLWIAINPGTAARQAFFALRRDKKVKASRVKGQLAGLLLRARPDTGSARK